MYSTVAAMIEQWGESEMIRLSTPADQETLSVIVSTVERALQDASDLIDSYVAKRYKTPMDAAPPVIARHCRILARYELMHGDGRTPSEQAKTMRDETIGWLRDLSTGKVLLEAEEQPSTDESFAQFNDSRRPAFGGYGGAVCGDSW